MTDRSEWTTAQEELSLDQLDRTVRHHIHEQDDLKFVIENYTQARPFTSFFPGIAGLMGIPLWCFYVNRGQGICSFGTDSKDGAILEFQPANKAYRLVGSHGFRTFVKYHRGRQEGLYEPFSESHANRPYKVENRMIISPWDLCLEERNETLGIAVRIRYFTIPEEPVAGLARIVTITNLNMEALKIEVLDGLPVIIPYGMWDVYMKNMSRTIEAWALVENLDRKVPYYRLKVNAEDGPEVVQIKEGNFYAGFCENQSRTNLLEPVIDPSLVFGYMDDMSYPVEFCKKEFYVPEAQYSMNRTGCAMGYTAMELAGNMKIAGSTESAVNQISDVNREPGGNSSGTVYSVIGHAKSLEDLNGLVGGYLNERFFEDKAERNRTIIRQIIDKAFVNSGSRVFNSYCRQNYLDNILRGGFPVSMEAAGKRGVLHVYSRRHGDPERDYNSFKLMPSCYSQGNGAYRDINQNRRDDVWFNPDAGYSNIVYFLNLIQLDGYNPLIVKGVSYLYDKENGERFLNTLVAEDSVGRLFEFLKETYLPHTLLNYINLERIKIKVPAHELISTLILHSRKCEEAEHGEGYWTDHWHYNLDLLESYEALYPDGMAALLAEEKLLSFYEDEYVVVPRKERYVLYNGRPRQFNCLRKDKRKLDFLAARECERNRTRIGKGEGDVYYTSLWVKLLCICVNKLASLDACGTGVEMEAGKPNWNDAINGLPSFFGSSVNETFELKRLILRLKEWLGRYGTNDRGIRIPAELDQFMKSIFKALGKNCALGEGNIEEVRKEDSREEDSRQFWEVSNRLKEEYRESILYGLDGKEAVWNATAISELLDFALAKVEAGIAKAFDPVYGIYHTYFINEPVEYEVHSGFLSVKKFKQIPLSPFLEGQVHAIRVEKDPEKARKLYEAIQQTDLYDRELGMYKTNASLSEFPMEIGRLRAFSPGWLENESVFLHMEYKYLLELLKSGLEEEFHKTAATALVPFMKPEVYGRSVFENSSFIASSVNPDKAARGCGFVARLSGTTAEFCNILRVMSLGSKPFYLNSKGELELRLNPLLPGWLFSESPVKVNIWVNGSETELTFEENTYAYMFLGSILLVYHNNNRQDTYGNTPVRITKIIAERADDNRTGQANGIGSADFTGDRIPAPYAADIRKGLYRRLDVFLE